MAADKDHAWRLPSDRRQSCDRRGIKRGQRIADGDCDHQRKTPESGEVSVEFLCSCCQAAAARAPRCASGKFLAEETGMAMQLGHVHIKTREDPQKVAKFYIDNFGATVKREIPGRGCQLDLHGVQLNVTTIIADQNHEQHVGIEHIAIETDEYAGALANFRKNGAQILEERVNNGRHVCWVAAPDGAQMELIEKV
jgi:predicted enzyme related to lactoylglutathione lyase